MSDVRYTNLHNIDLSMAVWLVADDYDFVPGTNAISATGLLKPVRQTILASRITPDNTEIALPDLSDALKRRMGHAIHDSIERAWKNAHKTSLKSLGLPQNQIDRVRINPTKEELEADPEILPVFIEVRGTKKVNGWTVGGKLDMSVLGRLKDIKTTSVYTYLLGRKDDDYILQGSIYRWLHDDKITSDEIDIQMVFTDWQRAMSFGDPKYPKIPYVNKTLKLMGTKETEAWVARRLHLIESNWDKPEEFLPRCTPEEMWMSDPVWKYYSNPDKTDGKATKNFDDQGAAYAHLAAAGKGVVKHFQGKPKHCKDWCPAFQLCSQKDEYDHD